MWHVPEPTNEWIESFLTVRPPAAGPSVWVSSFSAVVRDSRLATGRNLDSGEVEQPELAGGWLGALGYLVTLDQIGKCFRPKDLRRQPAHNAPLVKALTHFARDPTLSDNEILAIYALRCGFAHDYGLVSRSRVGRNAYRLNHRFLLFSDAGSPLVELPDPLWDGEWSTSRFTSRTKLNVRKLGDLVERIVADLLAAYKSQELVLAVPGGVDELFARFAMTISEDPNAEIPSAPE